MNEVRITINRDLYSPELSQILQILLSMCPACGHVLADPGHAKAHWYSEQHSRRYAKRNLARIASNHHEWLTSATRPRPSP